MSTLSRLQKYALSSIGAISGFAFVYYAFDTEKVAKKSHKDSILINEPLTTKYPSVNWDFNWDKRDPRSLVKPEKLKNPEDKNEYNKKCEAKRSKAVRHLILIRHGQYNRQGSTDEEKVLTELGRRQAEYTGKRLIELGLPYSLIVKSTMTRAQETSSIIEKFLPNVKIVNDSILEEGFPIAPEPPMNSWRPELYLFQDGPRIESAFRKYCHRAYANQERDSYTVLVCHSNVIRYFVCRALQFPPEAWLRISLIHASITWLVFHPNGKVNIKCLGDAGHLPQECLTTN